MGYNILIVGCGKLGKRYIESIDSHSNEYTIRLILVDPYTNFSEISIKCQYTSYKDISDIDNIDNIDLVIVSTCSDVRFDIINKIIQKTKIKNYIIEKIIFQKVEDYNIFYSLILKHNLNVWINTPRRTYDYYKYLKTIINKNNFSFEITGYNWNISSNAIHFIDLFCYFKDILDIKLILQNAEIIKSKRDKYQDILGTIINDDESLIIKNLNNVGNNNLIMNKIIKSDNKNIIIENSNGYLNIVENINGLITKKKYLVPLISETAFTFIKNIIDKGNCELPKYEEVYKIHIEYIKLYDIFDNINIT